MMKLEKFHMHAAKCASADKTRFNITRVQIIKDGPLERIEATDGRRALSVGHFILPDPDAYPIPDVTSSWTARVDGKSFAAALRDAKEGADVSVNGKLEITHEGTGATHYLDTGDTQFPNFGSIFPNERADDIVWTFNPYILAETLLTLAKSIGMKQSDQHTCCELRLPKTNTPTSPIKILATCPNTRNAGMALVMPIRI